jgi:hypothetical protein
MEPKHTMDVARRPRCQIDVGGALCSGIVTM